MVLPYGSRIATAFKGLGISDQEDEVGASPQPSSLVVAFPGVSIVAGVFLLDVDDSFAIAIIRVVDVYFQHPQGSNLPSSLETYYSPLKRLRVLTGKVNGNEKWPHASNPEGHARGNLLPHDFKVIINAIGAHQGVTGVLASEPSKPANSRNIAVLVVRLIDWVILNPHVTKAPDVKGIKNN